jgi:hypothetical protein
MTAVLRLLSLALGIALSACANSHGVIVFDTSACVVNPPSCN